MNDGDDFYNAGPVLGGPTSIDGNGGGRGSRDQARPNDFSYEMSNLNGLNDMS
jgi:hypothetical protein